LAAGGLWYFRTKGDYNYGPDSWTISQDSIVGKVVGVVPWVGYIPLYIRRPEGIIIIVILFLLVIFAEYMPLLTKKQTEQH